MLKTDLLKLRVGTRESKLAMLQTQAVVEKLVEAFPNVNCQTIAISTSGDKILTKPIAEVGTRGVFVKELEEALISKEVDVVVHSLKDLPTDLPAPLTLAAVLCRLDARDVLVSYEHIALEKLPPGARVATSSRRRVAQIQAIRSDLAFVDIRGNIPTRLRKLEEGVCDAMILAAAGLVRLQLVERITAYLDTAALTPAVGQGALAVECRADDKEILALLSAIDEQSVRAEITAERAFLDQLGGGCSAPIGAVCSSKADGQLKLLGCVASLNGSIILRRAIEGPKSQAALIGVELARNMLALGAREILDKCKDLAPSAVSPP